MTLIDWANRNLLNAIASTEGLIQIFIVIIFFENYFIITESKSFLDITIKFDQVKIAPIVYFFLFISISKIIWFITKAFQGYIFFSKDKVYNEITANLSFFVFTLSISIFIYLINISTKPSLLPFKQYLLSKGFIVFCYSTMVTCIFVFFTHKIKEKEI